MHHRDALRLRRAIHGGERNAMPRLANRQRLHPVIDVARQCRAAITHIFKLGEKALTQFRVLLHRLGKHGKGDGCRTEHARGNVIEILDRLAKQRRHRLAIVQMHRAARIDIAVKRNIASRNMVPRHPVEAFRHVFRVGLFRAQRFLRGHQRHHHAVRLQRALGHAG